MTNSENDLGEKLKQENVEFRAWVETLPDAHWAKYDLSACRLGWEAARARDAWRPIDTAPEDCCVLLATSAGWVGEAIMLRDDDTGEPVWSWAAGPVHPNHKPLGWMPMPTHPESRE